MPVHICSQLKTQAVAHVHDDIGANEIGSDIQQRDQQKSEREHFKQLQVKTHQHIIDDDLRIKRQCK